MPKILGMDEYHRCSKIDAVNEQLMQDGREGRKFQVDIRVASQLIEDFPEPVIKIATGVVAFSVGSESCIDYLDDIFTLSPNDAAILRHNLNGPSSRGAPFWAMFKTKHYKQVRQEMLLTLGPVELWAYSTTASDVALRSALYEQIGPKATRQVLAATFPSGTAKPEIDKRMKRLEEAGERGVTGQSRDVVAGLIKELKERSYIMNQ